MLTYLIEIGFKQVLTLELAEDDYLNCKVLEDNFNKVKNILTIH